MPIRRRRPEHPEGRRLVRDGDEYTDDELARGEVELEQVPPRPEPPVDVQGEPWGWTKPGPRPKGWREDGRYGPQDRSRDDGPLDGRWPDDEPD
jgi:hypothetical protein